MGCVVRPAVADGVNSVLQIVIADPKIAASVAFTVAKHELHPGPNCIRVGQRHTSSEQASTALSMMEHWGHCPAD